MSDSFECCVMSGKGLCVGLVTRPEVSYRVWRVQRERKKNRSHKGYSFEGTGNQDGLLCESKFKDST
jgi:hypothetical protein